MSILSVRQRDSWFVAGFNVGRLTDTQTISRATRELSAELERLPLRANAVLSFEGVEQASTQLVGLLRAARASVVDERFGRLVLCRLTPQLHELLRLTRIDHLFQTFPRLRDVLADTKVTYQPLQSVSSAAFQTTAAGDQQWID